MIYINNISEYELAISNDFDPLIDKRFLVDIFLRVEIQRFMFGGVLIGRGNIPTANDKYYHWVWDHKQHVCEETMQPIRNYSAMVVSHILSKGAHPEMAHDPRNNNILIPLMHLKWETGNREQMRIFRKN